MSEITPNPPLRHRNQRGSVCPRPAAEGLEAFLRELEQHYGRSQRDCGRYGVAALQAFLEAEGKTWSETLPEDFARFRADLMRRRQSGGLGRGKRAMIMNGARHYLRFLARRGRIDERAFFFELYPRPETLKPELLSPVVRELLEETRELLSGVSAHQGKQYRRGALELLLFMERRGRRVEDLSADDWRAYRVHVLGEAQAALSARQLLSHARHGWLTGALCFLRVLHRRGRMKPEQVPLGVTPAEQLRRRRVFSRPGVGLASTGLSSWAAAELQAFGAWLVQHARPVLRWHQLQGARALLVSLEEQGEAGLVPEGFLRFRDGLVARGPEGAAELSPSQVKVPLLGARAYLRYKIAQGALVLSDWLLLAYPGSFADAWRLTELRPLKPELSVFMARLRARHYSSSATATYRAGALLLLLHLKSLRRQVHELQATDWQSFQKAVLSKGVRGDVLPRSAQRLVNGARAFLRMKAEEGQALDTRVFARAIRRGPALVLPAGLSGCPARFRQGMDVAGLSANTRPSYTRALRDFLLWLDGEGIHDLAGVNRQVMTDYALQLQREQSRRGRPYAAATQGTALAALRFFFGWLVKSGELLSDPMSHLPRPRVPRHLPRPLKVREIERLLQRLPETVLGRRDRAMIELLYGTGMRAAELCSLTLEDLDFEQGLVFIREGKGKKDRLVPLGRRAREALLGYLDDGRGRLLRVKTQALFLNVQGTRLGRNWLSQRLRHLGERLGLNVRPHLLRHSCATHLLRGRADIRQIQRLLGHESLRTTERYTKVEIQDLRAVIKRCHPREKART